MTIATLVNVTEEDGVTIIVSKLRIKILPQYSISSISCHNVGHNTVNTSTFQCASESLCVVIIITMKHFPCIVIRVHVIKVVNIGCTQSTFNASIVAWDWLMISIVTSRDASVTETNSTPLSTASKVQISRGMLWAYSVSSSMQICQYFYHRNKKKKKTGGI